MSGSLRGGLGITQLVVRGQHLSRLHLPSSSSTSIQCLLHHPPPSIHPPSRQYTLQLTLPRQTWPFNSARRSAMSFPSARLSTSPPCLKTRPKVDGGAPESNTKRRQDNSKTITLIDAEDKVSMITLDKAERLAKRRDLKLVRIEDPSMQKSGKEVYKLMSGKQYLEEQMKAKRSEKTSTGAKDEKVLALRGNISPHDLAVKLHNVSKWLSKGHQIKVTISSRKATKEDVEKVFSTIEEEVKKFKGRVLQRHEKLDDLRFYIAPPKEKESVTKSEAAQGDDPVQSEESNEQAKA